MTDTVIEGYVKKLDRMRSDRSTFESFWDDVARITLPRTDFNNQYAKGQKRNTTIYDTTGIWANDQLAGGLHGMLTSPFSRWFAIRLSDPKIKVSDQDRMWLDQVTNIIYWAFTNPDSYFSNQAHEMYQEVCAFGTGVMYADFRDGAIRFRNFPLSQCFLLENDAGKVNILYRVSKIPVYEAISFFRDRATDNLKKIMGQNPLQEVTICHVVEPRDGGAYGPASAQKPFKSCFFDLDKKEKIAEGGYDEFPYMVPRWSKRSGEQYGFGPGMAAYHDIKMLNRIMEVTIRGAEKSVDPPLLVPDDSVFGPLVINPGGIINYRADLDRKVEPLLTNPRPDIGFDLVDRIRMQVMQHFYVDWMNLPQKPGMTATEVLQRRDERLRLLGPMLSRMTAEFTNPLIGRVFSLLRSNYLLPPPPPNLQGKDLKVEYLSPIAQAQKFSELDSITRSLQMASFIAQFDPNVMDNFKTDDVVRYASIDVNNMPQALLRTTEEMVVRRNQAQQRQQQAMEAELAETNTKAFKNAANASKFIAQAETIQ